MTATNHSITAANLALITKTWWILPIAFISHFVLDALPHYGDDRITHRDKKFITMYSIDFVLLCGLWLGVILATGHFRYLIMAAMAAAAIPDVVWIYRVLLEYMKKPIPAKTLLTRFHSFIQWGERSWGWVIELGWFGAMLTMLVTQVNKLS
jgi:hypothetical protein